MITRWSSMDADTTYVGWRLQKLCNCGVIRQVAAVKRSSGSLIKFVEAVQVATMSHADRWPGSGSRLTILII